MIPLLDRAGEILGIVLLRGLHVTGYLLGVVAGTAVRSAGRR